MRSPSVRYFLIAVACASCFHLVPSSALAEFTEQGATILGGANYSGRSASLADIDGDGDLDLMFQGAPTPGVTIPRLLRNNLIGTGSMTYTDITSSIPLALTSDSTWSAAWGDYNGDGKIDVFVGKSNSGITGTVLRNDTTTTSGVTTISFSDQSTATGLNDPGFAQNVAWADFNNDHRLDLIIGMEGPEKNEMYLQQANGTFSKQGAAVGIQAAVGTKSYGLAIGDYDGDGDLDVYISTCIAGGNIRNNFYKNMLKETGTLSFVDVADSNGTQNMNNTYGTQFIDFDNDGKLDLFVTGADGGTLGTQSKIYHNNGDGTFTDVDTITGHPLLTDVGSDLNGFKAVDYDNDGKLDLYFHDNLSGTGNQKLYHNDGNWQFTDVTAAMGLSGLANTGAGGYDSVWGDIDLDGDQDLIDPNNISKQRLTATSTNTPERVYINDASTNGNHWLYVKLLGPSWNTTGIDSSLYATLNVGTADQVTLRREANSDADTFNQSDLPVHFGLAAADHVDWLRIVWPDGTVQFLHNVTGDQYISVSYANALPGDFSGDGVVDAADFVLWRKYFGAPFTQDDYNTWRANFGRMLSAGLGTNSSVPEPTTLALWIAALAALAGKRGWRR